jgi:predicted dehydrogenase
MSKLRFGILGCARIVRRALVGAFQHTPTAELRAIASSRPGTARQWAGEFGIPRAYDSYEALLADPEIDAVYIPLPNELHREWTLRAAAAGKHVLCEKPLGLDLDDARQMVEGCRDAGVVLMEAFMWRHHPAVTRARQLVADGQLGEVRLVKMDFSFVIDPNDWRLDPHRGGGALYDLGCYGINAARLFTGSEPVEVIARARLHASGVDMTTALTLRFPGGVFALIDCSFESPDRNRLEIVGARGSLELPQGVLPSPQAKIDFRTEHGVETLRFDAADQYAEELTAFCAGVSAGRLPAPAENGLANMTTLDAARRQAWFRA